MYGCNQKQSKIKDLLHRFNKKYHSEKNLIWLLETMLKWKIGERVNFVELLDMMKERNIFNWRYKMLLNEGGNLQS
jgi:hypothetical protein